jgi:O-antigen/teichoic acid export membrane protein
MEKDGTESKKESSLGSISEGAGLFVFGRGVSNTLGLGTNVILTRILGTQLYGIYTYTNVIFSLCYVFARLGGDKSLLRFIPEYEDQPRKQRVVVTLAYGTSLLASVFICGVVFLFAPTISSLTLDNALFTDILRITAVVIPFNTLSMISYSIFKSMERMDYNVLTSSIVRPLFRLIFVGGAVVLGYSVIGAAAGLVVSGVLGFLVALALLVKKVEFLGVARPNSTEVKEYYNFSFPLTFNQLGGFAYSRTDILMVGFFFTGSAVGVYNAAFLLSRILSLPLLAFNQLFPPIASRLYQNGNLDELASIYTTVTKMIFTVSLFPAIAVLVYAPEVLSVFGEEFSQGQYILMLFVIAQLTNALVGPSGYLLMMSDHQYLTMFNQVSSGLLNIVLNYVLITNIGVIGAAVATASVLMSINALRIGQVWYFEGLSPYNWSYVKPVLAGALSGSIMLGFTRILEGYLLLISGTVFGGLSFILAIYALGVNANEKELIKNIFTTVTK